MNLFQILLVLHILGGSISLLLGLFIMITKKGNRIHKIVGKIYFYSMLTAAIVALPMSYLHPNYFLFIIGVFTAFMLLSGKRYLLKKKTSDVTSTDWLLTIIMLIFGLGFLGFGMLNLIKNEFFGIVFIAFGSISLLFVGQDYKNFKGKSSVKNYWLTTHIQRMTGSYIASVTAFIVVNNTILPDIIAWLLPTLIIVPLIIKWSTKYKIQTPIN
ncbi:DUF2306 domain-containing protein [Flavobacterium sp.]|uniref:DUF2306 domain-containing protein n=1 Tax=Flavobacterium sp. TaxID=239 RepID=UPI002612981B|nr:DUF2306 domain-containing protein [Flavobacterium sp.]